MIEAVSRPVLVASMTLFVATSTAPVSARIEGPVTTTGGLVAGVPGSTPSVTVFRGIPYAAPPVGELRWRPPQPATPWKGVRRADRFSPSCIQTIVTERKPWTHEFMAHGEIGEDCLSLNVWTPATSASARLPVLMFIHGGGNTEGSGSVAVYDGEGLARKGVVMVTLNYRLGVLGWFTHPELTKESPRHASGNYGLLDQVAALKWIQANIAAFGGDPARVTIAGQSAGAGAVHSLTASPLAAGLFHRGIAESGSGVGRSSPRPLADQEQDGLKFAEAKGARSLSELRAMSWQDLVAVVPGTTPNPATGATARWRFTTVVDGYALPAPVTEVIAQGKQNDVPFLTGGNAGEGGATPHPEITVKEFRERALQRFTDLAEEFLSLYPAADDAQAAAAQNASSWDTSRTSTYLWAVARARTARTPVYTYFWTHALPGPEADRYGAFHTSEVPYVLDSLSRSDRPFTDADRKIADRLSSYWANFAATGNPNGEGLPHWPSVEEAPGMTMEVGDDFRPIPVAGGQAKLDFLKKALARPTPPSAPRP